MVKRPRVKAGNLTLSAAMKQAGLASPSHLPHKKPDASRPDKPLNLEHPRNQQIANAARRRFEAALVTFEAGSRGLAGMNYVAVMALASSDDVAHWFKRLIATASNLHKIRIALKEYQK
ncbi:hypothetical protein LCGC14_2062740 [marine sediment metagenome]|uniref:Uncharacterized protein n=1 Tax=marine sediment metagenome TaxID=412755 RepID=A0A0F9EKU3_9ZZZZ